MVMLWHCYQVIFNFWFSKLNFFLNLCMYIFFRRAKCWRSNSGFGSIPWRTWKSSYHHKCHGQRYWHRTGTFFALISRKNLIVSFSAIQILCEIIFGEASYSKSAVCVIFWALDFVHLVKFSLQKVQKVQRLKRNHNSVPLNVLKWQILHF